MKVRDRIIKTVSKMRMPLTYLAVGFYAVPVFMALYTLTGIWGIVCLIIAIGLTVLLESAD